MSDNYDFKRRMNNWRMWRIAERKSLGGSPYPIYNLTPRPPRGENIVPILMGEAEETDLAVQGLSRELRRVVEVWYLFGGTINQKRKMLGCRRERMTQLVEQAGMRIRDRLLDRQATRTT